MDPATIAAGAKAAGALLGLAKSSLDLSFKVRALLADTDAWLRLDGSYLELNSFDIDDIRACVESREFAPLMQIAWITSLASGKRAAREMEEHFSRAAVIWCGRSGRHWYKNSESVWRALVERIDGTIDHQTVHLKAGSNNGGAAGLMLTLISDTRTDGQLRARLMGLVKDLGLLERSHQFAEQLRVLSAGSAAVLLSHLLIDDHVNVNDLYIDRTLSRLNGAELETSDLLTQDAVYHAVVLGNPGTGKSTLVRHLAQSALGAPTAAPVIVLECRVYEAKSWEKAVSQALWETIKNAGIHGGPKEFEGALLLGRFSIVFDGLDEISDKRRRVDMTERIYRFCQLYPLASVLVTCRSVGYEQAPLNIAVFESFHLSDYSNGQIQQYAEKWFTAVGRSGLIDAFLSDAQSVADIAVNPLMLSLLCNLYRAQGQLPTNRHSVYHKCATLLYESWDGARQVAVNSDMPDYGSQILESIAYFFWSTPASAANAEEGQLVKIIAVELQAQSNPHRALERAEAFLNFCAGRLWLLVKAGTNSRGQTLFSFAHRTFMEYFASEYIARRADGATELAQKILEMHASDSTSVMPELLLKSYNDKRHRGADRIFHSITDRGPADLILRLVNAFTISTEERTLGLIKVRDQCNRAVPPQTLSAMLTLYDDPRDELINLLSQQQSAAARRAFLIAWSRYRSERSWVTTEARHATWGEAALRLAAYDLAKYVAGRPPMLTRALQMKDAEDFTERLSLVHWCVANGLVPLESLAVEELLFAGASSSNRILPGVAFEATSAAPSHRRARLCSLLEARFAEGGLARQAIIGLVSPTRSPSMRDIAASIDGENLRASVGLACLLREARLPDLQLEESILRHLKLVTRSLNHDFECLFEARSKPTSRTLAMELLSREPAAELIPEWFPRWATRDHDLLRKQ